MIKMILARALNNVIGHDGGLPWHLPEDLKRFKQLTSGHIVLMGRKTWESLPGTVKPLSDRVNVVISSQALPDPQPHRVISGDQIELVLGELATKYPDKDIWVIGGQKTYETLLPFVQEIYETVVAATPEGDTFGIDPTADITKFQKTVSPLATAGWVVSKKGVQYRFNIYERVNLPQGQMKPWDPI